LKEGLDLEVIWLLRMREGSDDGCDTTTTVVVVEVGLVWREWIAWATAGC
jgi:hypothetical protein